MLLLQSVKELCVFLLAVPPVSVSVYYKGRRTYEGPPSTLVSSSLLLLLLFKKKRNEEEEEEEEGETDVYETNERTNERTIWRASSNTVSKLKCLGGGLVA